ncbi:MAG: hypothetical protein K0S46_2509 [Moraxellaceae bacterium]|jgi:hypothetical protein|nr:hypothetical protein [Moraxellaceae bacterium]
MDIRTPLMALALLAAPALAPARPVDPAELPAGFVFTWQDNALKGTPKRVLLQEEAAQAFSRAITEDQFTPEGIQESHLVSSGKGRYSAAESWRLRLDRDRMQEIVYSPTRFGGGFLGGSARPLRFDDEGRITLMAGGSSDAPAARTAALQEGDAAGRLTAIRYELNRQVHEVLQQRELVYRQEFEFAPNGRLRRSSCTEGRCGAVPVLEFGPDGPLLRQLGGMETRWHYENGVVVAQITRHLGSGVLTDQRHYEAYRFDACGNWTWREQYDAPPGTPGRRKTGVALRRIDYYTACPTR